MKAKLRYALELKAQREARRTMYEKLTALQPILAVALPGVLLTLTPNKAWQTTSLLASRNSWEKPRTYVKVTNTHPKPNYVIHTYDFLSRKGEYVARKYKETESVEEIVKTLQYITAHLDKVDGYRAPEDYTSLVNVTEDSEGKLTVVTLKRDARGRFMPNPMIDRGHTSLSLLTFLQFVTDAVTVASVKNPDKTMVVLKGKRVTVQGDSIDVKDV